MDKQKWIELPREAWGEYLNSVNALVVGREGPPRYDTLLLSGTPEPYQITGVELLEDPFESEAPSIRLSCADLTTGEPREPNVFTSVERLWKPGPGLDPDGIGAQETFRLKGTIPPHGIENTVRVILRPQESSTD